MVSIVGGGSVVSTVGGGLVEEEDGLVILGSRGDMVRQVGPIDKGRSLRLRPRIIS